MADEEDIQEGTGGEEEPQQPDVEPKDADDAVPFDGLEDEDEVQNLGDVIENTVEAFNDSAEDRPIFSETEGVGSSGPAGPLEVDSVGDFLPDVDWTPIDTEARERAAEARAAFVRQMEDAKAAEEAALQKRKDGFWGRKRAGLPPRISQNAEPDPPQDDPPVQGDQPANQPEPPEPPEPIAQAAPAGQDMASTIGGGGIFDSGISRNEEGLQAQRNISFDEPDLSVSAWDVPGQEETTTETSANEASDAITSMSLAMVQTMDMLASKLANHEQRLQIIQDMIDVEEDGDVC